jgi:hypothetical protein
MKKIMVGILCLFLCTALAFPQSLAELAKKEKDRRARLKGKPSIVLTNADLTRSKKGSALTQNTSSSIRDDKNMSSPSDIGSRGPRVIASQSIDQIDQRGFDSQSKKYATGVLETTEWVRNSSLSLNKPDGRFAQIEYFGFLDLELEAENRNGDDIAVYARRQRSGILPPTMNYALFAADRNGEWQYIGTGSGGQSPETFELGEISRVQKIRLVFRDYTDTNTIKRIKPHSEDYYMEIDAVEYLHF